MSRPWILVGNVGNRRIRGFVQTLEEAAFPGKWWSTLRKLCTTLRLTTPGCVWMPQGRMPRWLSGCSHAGTLHASGMNPFRGSSVNSSIQARFTTGSSASLKR